MRNVGQSARPAGDSRRAAPHPLRLEEPGKRYNRMTPATMTKAEPARAARPAATEDRRAIRLRPELEARGLPERPPHRELGRRGPVFRRLVHDPDGRIHRRGRLPLLPGRRSSSMSRRPAGRSAGASSSTARRGRTSGASPPRSATPPRPTGRAPSRSGRGTAMPSSRSATT